MAKLIIAARNRADGVTLSGGSWAATLPLANFQDRQVTKVPSKLGHHRTPLPMAWFSRKTP